MVTFEYKGKIYSPSDLDKKLKKLGITRDDITILEEKESKAQQVMNHMIGKKDETVGFDIYWRKGNAWTIVRDNLLEREKIIMNLEKDPDWKHLGRGNDGETEEEAIKRFWRDILKNEYHLDLKGQ